MDEPNEPGPPSVEAIAGDREHGSASVSVRAVELLRDHATAADDWESVAAFARDLIAARPSMAAVANRVNRAMSRASAAGTPEAVERAAERVLVGARTADGEAAVVAAERIAGERVFTLSRSDTVLDALTRGGPECVFVAESRPAREGVGVAEALAGAGVDATLCADAAAAHLLGAHDVDRVLVGADTVLPDGRVVNKVGTRGLAVAANYESVPFDAVCALDKVRRADDAGAVDLEPSDPRDLYDGPAAVDVRNPTFDVTPAKLVTGLATESGVLDDEEVLAVSRELATLADW